MSVTMTNGVNGRQRKSLEYQLDRLDSILDGLADALNGAVAESVRDAVGHAVREAVTAVLGEVVNNPVVLEKLTIASTKPEAAPAVPEPLKKESMLKRLWKQAKTGMNSTLGCIYGLVRGSVRCATSLVRACTARIRSTVAVASAVATLAGLNRRSLLLAFVVGLLVGVACYAAGPVVASAFGGLMAYATSLAATAMRPIWPLMRAASNCPGLMGRAFTS